MGAFPTTVTAGELAKSEDLVDALLNKEVAYYVRVLGKDVRVFKIFHDPYTDEVTLDTHEQWDGGRLYIAATPDTNLFQKTT